jgi:hypothetical protein
MCEYSQKQFEEGMAKLGCDSIEKLRAKLPQLRAELQVNRARLVWHSLLAGLLCWFSDILLLTLVLQDPSKFRQIYQFAYLFSR